MEQGNCLDSTRMSAVQAVETRTDGEPALDTAITNLLQAPTRATASEPVSAARPQDDVLDLADACIEQVARLDQWDANTGLLTEAQGDAEMKRWEAVFRRAIETPSAGLRDLAGKAYLMRADLERFHPLKEESTDDARLMRVILAEAMRFGGLSGPATFISGDPILALIEEGRRLLRITDALHARPEAETAEAERAAEEKRRDALRALYAHCDDVILNTVPLTAAGCRELARFGVEYFESNGVAISDDEQAITRLIAQSPLTDWGAPNLPQLQSGVIVDECVALADALIDDFGDEEIESFLTTDIALRERARRIRALIHGTYSSPDADLLQIGERWQSMVANAEAALNRLSDADEAFVAPETPRELRVYGYDIANGFPRPPQRRDGYAPYGLDQVEELRATPRMAVYIGGKPEGELLEGGAYRKIDPHGQKRAEEIIAAWDVWKAERDRRELALDIPALRIAAAEACLARDDAALRARSIKAQTIAGLRVKAEVAAALIPWRDRDAEAARLEADEETGILYTLVTDTLTVLGGTDVRRAVAR